MMQMISKNKLSKIFKEFNKGNKMKNKRWEDADFKKTRSVNYEALKLATDIRDQAFEIKFHYGKPSLPNQFNRLRKLVDKMEALLND